MKRALPLLVAATLLATACSAGPTAAPTAPITAAATTNASAPASEPTPEVAATPGASAGTSAPPAASPAASLVDFTKVPYVAELQNVQPDGSRSLDSALRLFAITFGPLPGVVAPTDQTDVRSGTLAIRAILAHQDELTPDQKAAVQAYL